MKGVLLMSKEEKDLVEATEDETKTTAAEAEVETDAQTEAEEVAAEVEAEAGTEIEVETTGEVETETPEAIEAPLARADVPMETSSTANERTWAALAHASILLTFTLGVSTGGLAAILAAFVPLVIWLYFRDRSRFVTYHAMQATVFQLGSLVAWVGLLVAGLVILIPTWILTALLLVILIGFLLLPLALVLTILLPTILIALPFVSLVYGLYGAYEVYAGRAFRYWLVADWIESREMKTA
jgi:uncharacterized Tic20 family protein